MTIQFRFPKDIPLDEYPKPETYLEEARHLTDEAQKKGLILRVMGPIALHFYFPAYVDLYRRMERLGERVFTDIDYAAYGKQRGKLVPFFESQGYQLEKRAAMLSGGTRMIFFGARIPMIDVFYDKLDYNHPIEYQDRLEINPHCVALTDLLLQKLQIVQINDKDIKDAMLLLLAAEFSEWEGKGICLKYLVHLFSEDWGFYHTATTNLIKVKDALPGINALDDKQRHIVSVKVDELLATFDEAPKSKKWKDRAKVGTGKIWYKEVSDWE